MRLSPRAKFGARTTLDVKHLNSRRLLANGGSGVVHKREKHSANDTHVAAECKRNQQDTKLVHNSSGVQATVAIRSKFTSPLSFSDREKYAKMMQCNILYQPGGHERADPVRLPNFILLYPGTRSHQQIARRPSMKTHRTQPGNILS